MTLHHITDKLSVFLFYCIINYSVRYWCFIQFNFVLMRSHSHIFLNLNSISSIDMTFTRRRAAD